MISSQVVCNTLQVHGETLMYACFWLAVSTFVASVLSCLGLSQAKGFRGRFLKSVQCSGLVLDSSREQCLEEIADTLQALLNGELVQMNRFRRLLLGRKAVGKTRFLTAVLEAAWKEGHILPCFVDYVDPCTAVFPASAMLSAAPVPVRVVHAIYKLGIMLGFVDPRHHHPVDVVNMALGSCGYHMLVVLDELQHVYSGSCLFGKQIIGQVSKLGGLDGRAVHCIISGSSSHLRMLATAKLSNELKSDYPHYTGVDLNSTKFSPRWIYPFLDEKSFRSFVSAFAQREKSWVWQRSSSPAASDSTSIDDIREDATSDSACTYDIVVDAASDSTSTEDILDDAAMQRLYFTSGGNAGCIMDQLRSSSENSRQSYTHSARRVNNVTETRLLTAMLQVVQAARDRSSVTETAGLADMTQWTSLVSVESVVREFQHPSREDSSVSVDMSGGSNCIGSNINSLAYRLADRGVLRFNDTSMSPTIGFGSPQVYLDVVSWHRTCLTVHELVVLKLATEAGERVALRLLASKASSWLGVDLDDSSVNNLVIPSTQTRSNRHSHSAWATTLCSGAIILNRMWKECYKTEAKDCFGADAVVPTMTDDGLVAHRIQLKLGCAKIKMEEMTTIVNKLKTHLPTTQRLYKDAGFEFTSQKLYIVTTRSCDPEVVSYCEQKKVIFVGAGLLTDKVWPDEVKALGTPYA